MSKTIQVDPAPATPAAPRPFQFRLIHLLIAMGVIGALLAVLVPVFRMVRQQARYVSSKNNLSQIGLALHNYHDSLNTFPPAYIPDANGKPMHSWRVLISPYMGGGRPWAYSFAEPWDGPNNRQFESTFSRIFRSPLDRFSAERMTSYVAVVGPGTCWPGGKGTQFSQIKDGTSNTILIVEISHSDIHWMEPRDVPIEELEAWLDPKHRPRVGGEIEGGLVLYADGSVHFIPRSASIKEWRALLTPGGNDLKDVPDDY
jgi:type II secretory pathway pseudopilin PulG